MSVKDNEQNIKNDELENCANCIIFNNNCENVNIVNHYTINNNYCSNSSNTSIERKKIVINVFQGGDCANQYVPFITALTRFQRSNKYDIIVTIKKNKDVKEEKWTVKELVNWLLDCDIHFILTHIHQGIREYLHWNMSELYSEILRLQAHKGFPNGEQLRCPMFTQDKYEYLKILKSVELANPTLKISLNETADFASQIDGITRFWIYLNSSDINEF
jgi:hypothetical protein